MWDNMDEFLEMYSMENANPESKFLYYFDFNMRTLYIDFSPFFNLIQQIQLWILTNNIFLT